MIFPPVYAWITERTESGHPKAMRLVSASDVEAVLDYPGHVVGFRINEGPGHEGLVRPEDLVLAVDIAKFAS